MVQVQTSVIFIAKISPSFCLRQISSDADTLPPQISSVTFLDKQRPWRMLQVCAHNAQCVCVCACACVCASVCVCICAHRICSSVQQRKEVTRWWGFQNWAAAVEEACALYVFFSPPLGLCFFLFCLHWYCCSSLIRPWCWEVIFNFLQTLIIHGKHNTMQRPMHLCVINFMNSKYGTSFQVVCWQLIFIW